MREKITELEKELALERLAREAAERELVRAKEQHEVDRNKWLNERTIMTADWQKERAMLEAEINAWQQR